MNSQQPNPLRNWIKTKRKEVEEALAQITKVMQELGEARKQLNEKEDKAKETYGYYFSQKTLLDELEKVLDEMKDEN